MKGETNSSMLVQDQICRPSPMAKLEKGRRNLHVDDCTVVSWDDEAELESGLKVVLAWKGLLKENFKFSDQRTLRVRGME